MTSGRILTDDRDIRELLEGARTIAVVGLSPKPQRDSHRVARYLKGQGYRIIPVRPAQKAILDEKAYKKLDDITERVDIVNVFRNPAQVYDLARETVTLRLLPGAFWMQLAIENQAAAELLTAAGIDVIMNRCIKVEHGRLFGQSIQA
jgi:hypothetical protein